MTAAAFTLERLGFRYPSADRDAVHDVSIQVPAGAVYGILGPNGSGKSTLLRLMVGGARPTEGVASFDGVAVTEWDRRALAKRVAVVIQGEHFPFPTSVRDVVAMGRYPHLGPWRREGQVDARAIEQAMERCGVADLASRGIQTLSGGERQRARLARALAQEPDTLVLDEPTASLDMHYEMAIFELVAGLAAEGVTIVVVTHNLNLAARYAGRAVLLDRGHVVAEGLTQDVITAEHISSVYDWPVAVFDQDVGGRSIRQITPM